MKTIEITVCIFVKVTDEVANDIEENEGNEENYFLNIPTKLVKLQKKNQEIVTADVTGYETITIVNPS